MADQLRLTPADPNDPEQDPTPNHSDLNDRRIYRRFGLQRPGKVHRRSSQQFFQVHSRDLSFGGALMEVESDRPFQVGEVLDVGISFANKAVIPAATMVGGVVVRCSALDERRQLVAVRYLHREPMQAAA
jgi:hypothetical protein